MSLTCGILAFASSQSCLISDLLAPAFLPRTRIRQLCSRITFSRCSRAVVSSFSFFLSPHSSSRSCRQMALRVVSCSSRIFWIVISLASRAARHLKMFKNKCVNKLAYRAARTSGKILRMLFDHLKGDLDTHCNLSHCKIEQVISCSDSYTLWL